MKSAVSKKFDRPAPAVVIGLIAGTAGLIFEK
jgi:hypothetical protein